MLGQFLGRGIGKTIKALATFAAIVLGMMLVLYTVNVVGRFVLNLPLLGADELVELAMAVLVFLALGYTALDKGHVRIELVTSHLSKRVQAILSSVTFLVGTGVWAIIGWQAVVHFSTSLFDITRTSSVLNIPLSPFFLVMAVGCFMFCLQLLVDFGNSVPQIFKGVKK